MVDDREKLRLTEQYAYKNTLDDDLAHDYEHIKRVVKIAKAISKDVPCDSFVVQMVALLHDVEDGKLNVPDENDVDRFLDTLDISQEQKTKILYMLKFMSFSKYPTLPDDFPIEGKIVQDADRLDAIGAIGVARTFSYGAFHQLPMYSDKDGERSTIAHFPEKLLVLHKYLYTDAAKKIAEDRAKYIEEFYKRFNYEIHQFD